MIYSIGIDLGGTFIKFGLVRSDGQLMYENTLPTEANTNKEQVINSLISAVNLVKKFAFTHDITVVGIGVGTPGIIDSTHRIILSAGNINGWKDVALSDILEQACGLPVSINNDANLMGLGEQTFGIARNCSDVLFLTIGTGIGGAIIINNKLFGGYKNRGSELGHIPLFSDGITCSCGSIGCLEAYASTSALLKQFEDKCFDAGVHITEELTGKRFIQLYKEGNILASETLNNHFRYLGRGVAGLINIFSPQRVVLGGGISEAGSFYIEGVQREVDHFVVSDCAIHTQLCAAQLGNKAGILGAAQWAFNCYQNAYSYKTTYY